MAEDLVKSNEPIPAGATIGGSNLSLTKTNEPIPQGATIGAPVQQTQPTDNSSGGGIMDTLNRAGTAINDFTKNVGVGAAKGAESTASGISTLLNKIPVVGEYLAPSAGIAAMKDQAQLQGVAQNVGYGGETLMEFLLGDEALQGLGFADKLDKAAKVAKTLEGSPRIMAALKIGAARIAESSLRAGIVQGTQTLARTQDVKQAVKEGGIMGGVSAILGVPVEAIRTAIEMASEGGQEITKLAIEGKKSPTDKDLIDAANDYIDRAKNAKVAEHEAGPAGEAEKALSEGLENAPDKKQIGEGLQANINDAETAMHKNFEEGIKDIHGRLEGETIEQKGSPISNKAQELLDNPPVNTEDENETLTAARGAAKDLLHPKVANILDIASKGEKETQAAQKPVLLDASGNPIGGKEAQTEPLKPWDIKSLTTFRTKVRQLAEQFQRGDINSRTLRQLLPSIDDTIQQMASKAGDDAVGKDYEALRDTYKNTVKYFEKPEYKIIQKLQAGNVDDAGRLFLKGANSIDNAEKLNDFFKQTLGDEAGKQAMDKFTNDVFSTMVRDASDADGVVDASKLVKSYEKVSPDVRKRFFADESGLVYPRIQNAINNASMVAGTKEALETQVNSARKVLGNITAPKEFLSGPTAMQRIDTLRELIGPENTAQFSNNVFNTLLRDSTNNRGTFDAAKFLNDWKNINPEIRDNFFKVDTNLANARIAEILKDAKAAANAQHLARAGLLTLAGTAGGGLSHLGAGIGTLLGLVAGAGESSGIGGIVKGRELLDLIANRPATWKMFKAVDAMAKSKVTSAAGKAVKMGITKGVTNSGSASPKRIYKGAAGPLGG